MAARVLVVGQGAASLRRMLGASAAGLLLEEAASVAEAAAQVRRTGPDVAVVTATDPRATELVEALSEDAVTAALTVLVVDDGDGLGPAAARLVALGARVVPGTEAAVRRAIDETLATSAWLAGRRVLVADDDPGITWYFADLLRGEGATVDDVLDGRAGLDRALAATPDLVVADLLMPGLDGVRLVQHLRLDSVLRDVPVVLLSWKEDWLTQAREAGTDAWGYLAKRAEPSHALTCLRSALASRVRFEMKMRSDGTVRGVLEDTTAHRLLTTAAEARPDCRISVRDGEALHEVQLRAGRPVSATRVSLQGSVVRGSAALGSLLALRTGKFVATREHGAADAQMDGPLAAQLAAQVTKLRAGAARELPVTWAPWSDARTDPAPMFVPEPMFARELPGAGPAFEPGPLFSADLAQALSPAPAPAAPAPAPPQAQPQPTITLRMAMPAAPPRTEAPQATAPLPTLRLPRPFPVRPDMQVKAQATPVARVERRSLRGVVQAAAVVVVALAGLATGVALRAYNSMAERSVVSSHPPAP